MTLTFAWESVVDLFEEPNARELVLAQYEELDGLKDKIPLDPDFARMRQLEQAGLYKIWAARRDGLLVGFIEFTITTTLHHRTTKVAMDGGYFLHPAFCDIWTLGKMWRSAEAELRDMGCMLVMSHDNPSRPLPAFFKRLGYQPAGALYVKVLGR